MKPSREENDYSLCNFSLSCSLLYVINSYSLCCKQVSKVLHRGNNAGLMWEGFSGKRLMSPVYLRISKTLNLWYQPLLDFILPFLLMQWFQSLRSIVVYYYTAFLNTSFWLVSCNILMSNDQWTVYLAVVRQPISYAVLCLSYYSVLTFLSHNGIISTLINI